MSDHTLDTKKAGCQFLIEGLHVGDRGIRTFNFHFCEGQEPFQIPQSCTATLYAVLPDKNSTTVYAPCKITDNAVVYDLSGAPEEYASITSHSGRVDCEIRLTTIDKNVLTSPKFSFIIEDVLQNDSAVEAEDSFSALTDALGRVLEAEDGLSLKIDKVSGATVGNVAVFGEDGALSDSAIGTGELPRSYIFIYDESKEYNDYNRALFNGVLSDIENGKSINVFINDAGVIYPATYEKKSSGLLICACDYAILIKIQIYTSGNVQYSCTENYNSTGTFDEAGKTPASQKLTADWVKQLIDDTIAEGAW